MLYTYSIVTVPVLYTYSIVTCTCAIYIQYSYLRGEHGNVVELSAPSLLYRNGEKEAAGISGEDRLLVLQERREHPSPPSSLRLGTP